MTLWLAVLAGSAMLLMAASVGTASPPGAPIPSYTAFLQRWSGLHGGYDPSSSRFVDGWLRIAYTVARPLAGRGVQPDALAALGLLISLGVIPLAAGGTRWPLLAAGTVVLAGLVDSLDGTVAVLTDRASRFGYVLDSVVDRLSDTAFLLALWRLGAFPGVCVTAGLAIGLLEYTRARAGNAGMGEIGVVTVGERGTRIPLVAATLGTAGLYPGHAADVATLGAATTLALSAIGLGQFLVVARRSLR
ncbi:MAG: CDP-alcohol phosphatidyltransferase family protein [Frankiaceae bacterium]